MLLIEYDWKPTPHESFGVCGCLIADLIRNWRHKRRSHTLDIVEFELL